MVEPARPTRGSERLLAAEQLNELRALRERMTEFAGLLQGNIVNHVLAVETFTFGSDGEVSRSWHAAAGSVEVTNHGDTDPVTVYSGGALGAVPAGGTGVYRVPPSATRTIALASRQVTFYGTEDVPVSYQAFTAGVRPTTG